MVMLVGVQSNQFPRALDLARPLRERGIQVGIGGFHVSGVLSMLNGDDADLDRAKAHGHLAVRRRGRRPARRGAARRGRGHAQAALQFHERSAGHRGHADPADGGRARAAHGGRRHQLRRRPRLSVPVLVLHHHQRAGPQVAPPLARRRRADRAGQLRAGPARLLHHRRQFRPQQGLGADPRPPDPPARGGEVQHQLHHPGRHAVPQAAEFHREVRARRRQARLHRAGEHQSGQSGRRQEAAEQDHRIPQDAARLEEGRRHHLCRLHPRLPERHVRVDHARHRRDQARTAGRPAGVLLSDAAAGLGGSSEAAPRRRAARSRPEQIRPQPRLHDASEDVARGVGARLPDARGSATTRSSTSRRCCAAWRRPRPMPATRCS